MKTLFLSILLFAFSFTALSQSNLTIFNNGDHAFHVMLNGIKQNQFPQKNVTISNISSGGHALKVVFANGASADINKKLYLDEPSDIRMSVEFKKGVGKLKIISYEPTKGSQANSLAFRPNDNAVYGDAAVSNQSQPNVQNQGTVQGTINSNSTSNSNTTTTVTTTNSSNQTPANGTVNLNVGTSGNTSNSSTQNSTNGNLNLNVGANGMNMNVVDPVTGQAINMNVNMNMNGVGNTSVQSNSSTTTTTTVTSTSTTSNKPISTATQPNSTNSTVTTNSSTNPGISVKSSAKITCSNVLLNFDSYLKQIKELSFESDQVEAIQKDLKSTCLTSSEAYKLVEVLTFESNRLDIAKYLSDRMLNRDKAGDLLPLFTFDSNKVEYKNYIR
jgi:hypothetical protein